jgi:apolipoprotein N-acyltransferase
VRLDLASSVGEPTVLVAAVGTDNDVGGLPLPSRAQRERWDLALFERTRKAAQAGAELVVWTEAASVVEPADETEWLASVGELAREQRVAIVVGYIVPLLDRDPFEYENAYALLGPDGALVHRYLKHHPVPGEPAVRGTEQTPMHTSETLGEVSGAICYDYDFPAMARARGSADLVALPSSDWRGIDPIHTHMARLRAIEGGHSVLRSTRFGLSAGIDSTGVIRGQLSHFDDDERILLVHLPRHGRASLSARLGEWFAVLSGMLAAVALVRLRARG